MPWLDIPDRALRMFYIVNAPISLTSYLDDSPPESNPLDPSKPCVVFLHAAASFSAAFASQMNDKRLTGAFNLIACDARLAGRTTGAPRVTHTLQDSATCLMSGLDQLELPSYAIVGEGYHGATAAVWIAIKRPQKVLAICLVSPGWFEEPKDTVDAMLNEWLPAALVNKDGNGDGSGTIPVAQVDIFNDYFFGRIGREPEPRAPFADAFQKRYGPGHDSHDIKHVIGFMGRKAIPVEELEKITAPVLILQGGDDTVTSPREAAERWQVALKNAKGGADLRVIQGAPHLLMYIDFGVANRYLLAFVQRHLQ